MTVQSVLACFVIALSYSCPSIAEATKSPQQTGSVPGEQPTLTQNTTETRHIMTQLFTSLTTVLPLSLDQKAFTSPENKQKILTELKRLKDSSTALITHTKPFEESFGFIARAMRRDIQDIYARYERGSYHEARFLLHQVSENCVSCHAKLPDPDHAPDMSRFFANINISVLPVPERAKLEVALRQFDAAQKAWETYFASGVKTQELIVSDALTEYLKIMIRVKQDGPGAARTLKLLSDRPDTPRFIKRDIESWQKSLTKNKADITRNSQELAAAKKVLRAASQSMNYPMDRSGLVDFIVANGLLNRFLNSEKSKPTAEQRAEAYYLLGKTEALIGRSSWFTQTNFYFESAIRAAPTSTYADQAYDALEQQILLEYSGSGGVNIPEDVQSNLDELKQLISKKRR